MRDKAGRTPLDLAYRYDASDEVKRTLKLLPRSLKQRMVAIEKGRDVMRKVMDSDSDGPDLVPWEYLDECTDRFDEGRKLGQGAFSTVYMGKDEVLRRKFAVKRMRMEVHGNVEEAKRTFERELATLKHFRHPNIARLYGYFLSPDLHGHQCLVFELAAKGSLHDFLYDPEKRKRLHWTLRVRIAHDVVKALHYLHNGFGGNKCLHRDVKSANICLRRDFTALLIDCGVSEVTPLNESNATMTIMSETGEKLRGTPGYICPTYARSYKSYASENEVFSVGIVLVEIFSGLLQNSRAEHIGSDGIDLFNRFSQDGIEKRDLVSSVDKSAGKWSIGVKRDYAKLASQCIVLDPAKRPSIQAILNRLGKLASQARPWSSEEKNRITVLFSNPLVWMDKDGLHPISETPNFEEERNMLVQCLREAKRDISLTFDVATDDRLHAASTRRCGCLHFSGHGCPQALLFEDGLGGAHFLEEDQLRDRVHAEPFKFVFVSACHSGLIAKALVKAGVRHVVCCDVDKKLQDDAALKFTHSFYYALAEGFTIQAAFEKGQEAVSKRFDREEVQKFQLLPKNKDHSLPLFDAEMLDWEDERHSTERFIPVPPEYFFGREIDMYKVLREVVSQRLVTVVGEKGIGCSSLASALATYISDRKNVILNIEDIYFVRRKDGEMGQALDSFIMPLHEQLVAEGKTGTLPDDFSLHDVSGSICEALSDSKALVFFDGADTEDKTLTNFVTSLFENTNTVKLLVTGRTAIGFSEFNVEEHVYRLGPLDIASTAILFGKMCPHADTPKKRESLLTKVIQEAEVSPEESTKGDLSNSIFERLGGGHPSATIRAAKEMPKEEYDDLICEIGTTIFGG